MEGNNIPIFILAWGQDIRQRNDLLSKGLRSQIELAGFRIVDEIDGSGLQVYLDLPESLSRARDFGPNAVLVVFEPRIVNPSEYDPGVLRRFKHVVRLSHLQMLPVDSHIWRQGQIPETTATFQPEHTRQRFGNESCIGMVNENKQSLVRGSQYATRVRAIQALARAGFSVSVAGKNWDRPMRWLMFKYFRELLRGLRAKAPIDLKNLIFFGAECKRLRGVNFIGPVYDAVKFLESVDIALVIENESNYVSEKLFQALFAGTFPIYIGPPLKEFDIPGVALEFQGSIENLPTRLLDLTQAEITQIRQAAKAWLATSSAFDSWGLESSHRKLALFLSTLV